MSDGTGVDQTGSAPTEGQTLGEVAAAAAHPSDLPTPGQHGTGSLWKLTLGSIGVVYGDIGTSPIYAMRESLHAASEDGLTSADVVGVISLLIWALILIVSVKYVTLIMRADNRGEGGTLSLVALVQQATISPRIGASPAETSTS